MIMIDEEELLAVQKEALDRAKCRGVEIISDGVLDSELYEKAPVKVAWVLKQDREDCQDGSSYADRIRAAAKAGRVQASPTWAPMAYASYALIHGVSDYWKIPNANDCATAMLSTAVFEIQKELGNPSTRDSVVRDGHRVYGDLLARQIRAADPDVMIVCLPETLRWVVMRIKSDVLTDKNDGWRWGNCAAFPFGAKLFLWAWHPAQTQISQEEYVMSIVKRWREHVADRRV